MGIKKGTWNFKKLDKFRKSFVKGLPLVLVPRKGGVRVLS